MSMMWLGVQTSPFFSMGIGASIDYGLSNGEKGAAAS